MEKYFSLDTHLEDVHDGISFQLHRSRDRSYPLKPDIHSLSLLHRIYEHILHPHMVNHLPPLFVRDQIKTLEEDSIHESIPNIITRILPQQEKLDDSESLPTTSQVKKKWDPYEFIP